MKKIILLLALFVFSKSIIAQEMNVTVSVNTPKIQTADPKVFTSLEANLKDFFNNQKWTDETFELEERINCKIQLTIREELSATSFKADLAIQASRPVYGSNYETALLNHVDKDFTFSYEQFQPIDFSRNVYTNNLTSTLAFYIYYILGMDYDSFSPFGGEIYFQAAQDIMTNIPSDNPPLGWRPRDGNRNRYWMIENALNPRVRPFRQAMYDYHRLSLDVMSENPTAGKEKMMEALEVISKVNKDYPASMIIQMFNNSKSSELIEIFKGGSGQQKNRVKQIMRKLDPSNANTYNQIGI